MRKLIIAATTIAVLAVPAISMASAYVPHYRVTSLTATTTYNGTSYVHNYTLTRGENHSFTGIASAGSVTPSETVSGTLHHSKIDISGTYPNGYTWSYDGSHCGRHRKRQPRSEVEHRVHDDQEPRQPHHGHPAPRQQQ